jgi:AraC-like DNA-binding protein
MEQASPHDAADELRRQLCTELLKAKCSAEAMAGRLSIHRRTLNRRLSSEGTGFKAIADEMRAALARQLLADTELSLAHIAAALDYSEAAAFTHALLVGWSAAQCLACPEGSGAERPWESRGASAELA